MEIRVYTSFFGPITRRFFVKLSAPAGKRVFDCSKETDGWDFMMLDGSDVVLESRRKKLTMKETFLGHEEYDIIYRGSIIGVFKKSLFHKEIVSGENRFMFPRLFNRAVPGLKLEFPLSVWLWRRTVAGYCRAVEEKTVMLAIAMTIYIWFTWNRVGAD